MDMISAVRENASPRARMGLRGIWQSPLRRREAMWGYAFISPWMIGFFLFYALPIVVSFGFTLFRFELSNPDGAEFVGLANWQRMLFNDPTVWESLFVTFKFALISLPIGLIMAFLLAVLLNSASLAGRNVMRTLFYAPTMVPAIAGILIWSQVLNPSTGWLNRGIEGITGLDVTGPNGIRWLDDPATVYIAYTLIGIWGIGNAIIINLAALQNVPTDLYDSAQIDGAGWWRRMYNITLPMISPVIFYNLVLSTIGLMQYFIVPFVLNGGSGFPEGTTNFYMIYFFKQAFTFTNMGYGATLAWLMFIIALLITIFLFGTARYWVYYSGERRDE